VQRIGCGIWLILLLWLPLFGLSTAHKHKVLSPIGLGWGAVTWVALFTGYIAMLSIIDWRDRRKHPEKIGVPKWVVPTAWCIFIVAIITSVMLFRRLRGG
jgi:hypothetical protein